MYSEPGVEQGDEHWSDWCDTYLFLPDFHVRQQLTTRGQPSYCINSPYFAVSLQTHLVDVAPDQQAAFCQSMPLTPCRVRAPEDEIPHLELSSVLRK